MGYVHPQISTHIYKLNKVLYDLKQATQAWPFRLTDKLVDLGFTNSHSNNSLFVYISESLTLYVLAYVDDILITGSNAGSISHLLVQLNCDFAVKELGPLHNYLGMEVI